MEGVVPAAAGSGRRRGRACGLCWIKCLGRWGARRFGGRLVVAIARTNPSEDRPASLVGWSRRGRARLLWDDALIDAASMDPVFGRPRTTGRSTAESNWMRPRVGLHWMWSGVVGGDGRSTINHQRPAPHTPSLTYIRTPRPLRLKRQGGGCSAWHCGGPQAVWPLVRCVAWS